MLILNKPLASLLVNEKKPKNQKAHNIVIELCHSCKGKKGFGLSRITSFSSSLPTRRHTGLKQKLCVRIIYIFASGCASNSEGAVGLYRIGAWAFKDYEPYIMECSWASQTEIQPGLPDTGAPFSGKSQWHTFNNAQGVQCWQHLCSLCHQSSTTVRLYSDIICDKVVPGALFL